MKTRIHLILLLYALITQISAQSFEGCVLINFEELPNNQIPVENLPISNQFFADYGITFSLENGSIPVLAEVGGATTAFSSAFGGDTPAPGQGIGSFFITDDGQWSGSTSPALLVNFSTPIDSFSACVLDIDGTEEFYIEAIGMNGVVIDSITIKDGDEGTGDGQSTCFGFNSEGCEGAIYSIRFKGIRPGGGTFGLGMDNFSFCAAGVDILNLITIQTQAPNCQGGTGSITIINAGVGNYNYSLDNGVFQSQPIFENVSQGVHLINIQDEEGCETSQFVFIEEFIPLEISNLVLTHTSCNENNGLITVFTSASGFLQYSIDGENYQNSNIFSGLNPGIYSITIVDTDGCFAMEDAVINPSSILSIEAIEVLDDYCNDANGEVTILATGGVGILQYSVNEQAFSPNFIIDGLAAGDYLAEVLDEANCHAEAPFLIPAGVELSIDELDSQNPDCASVFGQITIQGSGNGTVEYWLNDSISHPSGTFVNLFAGFYQLFIIDEQGCELDSIVTLSLPLCPVYIPNGFSPNNDGINDEFQIFTNAFYDVEVLSFIIFDRWGELVWKQEGFTINTFRNWWDGYFRNEKAMQAVYTYVVEVRYQNGFQEVFAGDVTLVR